MMRRLTPMTLLTAALLAPAAVQAAAISITQDPAVYTDVGAQSNGALVLTFPAQTNPPNAPPQVRLKKNPTEIFDVVVNGSPQTGTVSLTMLWWNQPRLQDNSLPTTRWVYFDVQYSLASSPATFMAPTSGGLLALTWDWNQFADRNRTNFAVDITLPGVDSNADDIYAYRFFANRVI